MYNNNMNTWNSGNHTIGFGSFGPHTLFDFPLFALFAGILFLCVLIIKGFALWHAAKRDEKWWFIILLIVNTAGLLELFYLIFVAKVLFNKKGHPDTCKCDTCTPASTPAVLASHDASSHEHEHHSHDQRSHEHKAE